MLSVPLVPDMIHRPDVPAHMMRVKPFGRRVRIDRDGEMVAQSDDALMVIEIGKDVGDPVFYLPMRDVAAELSATGRSTHCPLKGDTTYYDMAATAGREPVPEIGWVYTSPLPIAKILADHIAFDPAKVAVTILPS